MLQYLDKGYTVINVDESIINSSDLRRMKWRMHNQTNSVTERVINPSLSMIAAVSTEGNAYMALS